MDVPFQINLYENQFVTDIFLICLWNRKMEMFGEVWEKVRRWIFPYSMGLLGSPSAMHLADP